MFLPGESHGQWSLVGCSPWGRTELDTTEWLHFHFSLSCIGEGNGNPLQWSCLENPRDSGAWWAAVYGVAQSRTRLKWLSSSSSSLVIHQRFSKIFKWLTVLFNISFPFLWCLTYVFIFKTIRVRQHWYYLFGIACKYLILDTEEKDPMPSLEGQSSTHNNIHWWFLPEPITYWDLSLGSLGNRFWDADSKSVYWAGISGTGLGYDFCCYGPLLPSGKLEIIFYNHLYKDTYNLGWIRYYIFTVMFVFLLKKIYCGLSELYLLCLIDKASALLQIGGWAGDKRRGLTLECPCVWG